MANFYGGCDIGSTTGKAVVLGSMKMLSYLPLCAG
jgi:hypothetical protein